MIVIGAGGRGGAYASYVADHPDQARIVGVAEPRDGHRTRMAAKHGIPVEHVFRCWREVAARPRFADAVLICTQDAMHEEPAAAFAGLGYHILLEKPMAPDAGACRRIVKAAQDADVIFAVCHVLRYTEYTRILKGLLNEGAIGDIVDVQLYEPVGFWHQAHSFVRGNWRNEAESSFMLLAKCCHDVDWLRYLVGKPCRKVSSFGSLRHFRKDNQPPTATDRCLTCPVEPTCPYSAKRFYFGRLKAGQLGWPLNVVAPQPTEDTVREALTSGPYGRCVYACDNDVVDHQMVNFEYAGGVTACLTMSAFNPSMGRQVRIGGTRGYIEGDSSVIRAFDYVSETWRTLDTRASDASMAGGHGGGDAGLIKAFIRAIATNDRSCILSGPDETLESHLTVFMAEDARRQGQVLRLGPGADGG
jgi:predicted dehydrogenase